jgi:hypothetical protein
MSGRGRLPSSTRAGFTFTSRSRSSGMSLSPSSASSGAKLHVYSGSECASEASRPNQPRASRSKNVFWQSLRNIGLKLPAVPCNTAPAFMQPVSTSGERCTRSFRSGWAMIGVIPATEGVDDLLEEQRPPIERHLDYHRLTRHSFPAYAEPPHGVEIGVRSDEQVDLEPLQQPDRDACIPRRGDRVRMCLARALHKLFIHRIEVRSAHDGAGPLAC